MADHARAILFRREYRGPTGGHFKVWDYFQHAAGSRFRPTIYFDPDSVWDRSNPWLPLRDQVLRRWQPHDCDVLFLAGLDWAGLPVPERRRYCRPIINLIQDYRYADASHPLSHSLGNYAVRICVSQPLADAVLARGKVNGPLLVVPNGLDLESLPAPVGRDLDVVIVATKRPTLGMHVAAALPDLRVHCLTEMLPRDDYLRLLGRADLAVTLPLEREGFYLPALEAMAMGTTVICLDAGGNRSFCQARHNCLFASADPEDLVATIRAARALDQSVRRGLVGAGRATAARHDIRIERRTFVDLLDHVEDLWYSGAGESSCP